MHISVELEKLAGVWQGKNLLWLSEEPIESGTTATVRMAEPASVSSTCGVTKATHRRA